MLKILGGTAQNLDFCPLAFHQSHTIKRSGFSRILRNNNKIFEFPILISEYAKISVSEIHLLNCKMGKGGSITEISISPCLID